MTEPACYFCDPYGANLRPGMMAWVCWGHRDKKYVQPLDPPELISPSWKRGIWQ